MISHKELENLSSEFKIDKLSVFREYLQLLFLNYLYRERESEKVFFKGGTCLHLLYNSPRFSEDLDFSTTISKTVLKNLLQKITENIKKEVISLQLIFVYSGKNSLRFKIRYQGKEFKYPLNIRADFTFEKPILKPVVSKIKTKLPVYFPSLILSLDEREIFAEKIRAFLKRGKGRDVFDIWYLFSEDVSFEKKLIKEKLKKVNLKFDIDLLSKKIKNYPFSKLRTDLSPFLPQSYRKIIPQLKEEVLIRLKTFQHS